VNFATSQTHPTDWQFANKMAKTNFVPP